MNTKSGPTTPRPVPRTDHHRTVTSVALTVPAVRLVVVQAWANRPADGEPLRADHEILPVLAMQATAGHDYVRRFDERRPPPISADHRDMVELGWRYNSIQTVEYDVVVMTPDFGISDATFVCGDMSNGEYEIVACPWPPDEDGERLAGVVEELGRKAIEKVSRQGRDQAASPIG